MAQSPAERRFLSTTRGQILALVRQRPRTVEELRSELGVTENAVRHQLTRLQQDGLIRQVGVRSGTRRPAAVFGPGPEAERFFSKPYAPLLRLMLDSLAERLPAVQREAVARDVGRRLAEEMLASGEYPRRARRATEEGQLNRAVHLLARLGGAFSVAREQGGPVLRGTRCPLAVVRPAHSEVCVITEEFLRRVVSPGVQTRCGQDAPARCEFAVGG